MNWHSESKQAKRYRLERWHKWFAWRPTRIHERIYWLETIERKRTQHEGWNYSGDVGPYYEHEYRTVGYALTHVK